MSFELEDFRTQVLEASQSHPVVVDFWAPWCGPCKTLGPVLEKLATAAKGAWSLVKINVDEHSPIAAQFGVRSIPAVFMVYQASVIGHFSGAQSAEWVQSWLKKHLPEAEGEAPEEAIDESQPGHLEQLEAKVKEDPEAVGPRIALGKALLFGDPGRAATLLSGIPETAKEFDQVQQLGWLCELLNMDPDGLPDAPKIKPHFLEALAAIKGQNFEAAMDSFLEVLYRDKTYAEDAARKGIVGIFTYLGRNHDLPKRYHRRFEMALF